MFVVGTGVWKPNALHIKGETLGHVHFGINYLNSPESFKLGQRVIVIGAGNAAMLFTDRELLLKRSRIARSLPKQCTNICSR